MFHNQTKLLPLALFSILLAACADSGGAWDHQKDTCQFGPNDPRSKK